MYILINRNSIIIDQLHKLRYIKPQIGANYIIACPQSEGVGIIGSDCDTHYPLQSADITNNPSAVKVIEWPTEIEDFIPYKYIYIPENEDSPARIEKASSNTLIVEPTITAQLAQANSEAIDNIIINLLEG